MFHFFFFFKPRSEIEFVLKSVVFNVLNYKKQMIIFMLLMYLR